MQAQHNIQKYGSTWHIWGNNLQYNTLLVDNMRNMYMPWVQKTVDKAVYNEHDKKYVYARG